MNTPSGTIHRAFPLTGPIQLDVKVGVGSVTAHARDDLAEAVVSVTPRQPQFDLAERVRVDMNGSTLVVHAAKLRGVFDLIGGGMGRTAVDIDVVVPSGTPMKIASYGADVVVDGRAGSTDIAAGSSRTELDHVDGSLRLRYGSGPARVARVSGPAEIKSGSGTVRIGDLSDKLVMACGSGSLEVNVAHGPVSLRAGTGQAAIGITEADVDLVTGSGGLTVGLRPGQVARLDVTTGSGQLLSDLPVENTAPSSGRPITIRARTGSGDVRITRAAS